MVLGGRCCWLKEPTLVGCSCGSRAVSPRAASSPLQLLGGVFQLLPSAAEELASAAESQSRVEIKDLMEFAESEPLALGVEEVRGYLPCLASTFPAWHTSGPGAAWSVLMPRAQHHSSERLCRTHPRAGQGPPLRSSWGRVIHPVGLNQVGID